MSFLIALTSHKLPNGQVKNVKEITLLSPSDTGSRLQMGRGQRARLPTGLNVAMGGWRGGSEGELPLQALGQLELPSWPGTLPQLTPGS